MRIIIVSDLFPLSLLPSHLFLPSFIPPAACYASEDLLNSQLKLTSHTDTSQCTRQREVPSLAEMQCFIFLRYRVFPIDQPSQASQMREYFYKRPLSLLTYPLTSSSTHGAVFCYFLKIRLFIFWSLNCFILVLGVK